MSNLPIRRVVLYKHGVGYFEREAAVDGDQALSLAFRQREVSDVLKSLTVLDLDGGAAVLGVILGIDKTETRTEFGIQESVRLSLLTDPGEVRTFDLFDAELTLLDDGLKRDL